MSRVVWGNIRDLFGVRQALRTLLPTRWIEYTPTWTGSSSNPAIGNGVLTGKYIRNAFLCYVTIEVEYGSTTTAGSGTYKWTIPVPRAAESTAPRLCGSAFAFDTNVGTYYTGVVVAQSTEGNTVSCATHADTSFVGHNTPVATWATGDRIVMSLTYPIKAGY